MNLTVVRNLGSGGFGVVDLVTASDGVQYARKTFAVAHNLSTTLTENVRKRFVREARIQSGVRHANIVPVLYAELSANPPYYLMPVALGSLQDQLDQDRTLNGEWMSAVTDIVAALDELHQMGIYHRDLKPQNVLRYYGGQGGVLRDFYAVSDFGLIAMNESRVSVLTTTGMAKNTDYYTAPEITSDLRQASPQSDIYSLGCILHEIIGTGPRVPCAEIREDGPYGAILRNCTRTDPNRRFRSVRSVLDALAAVGSHLPVFNTAINSNFADQLATGGPLDEGSWRALIDFVEDNEGSEDARAVLGRISYEQVGLLCRSHPDLGDRLGAAYARWVHTNSFPFEWCDRLANVLEVFAAYTSFETRSDAIMAMLELGTSHNRYYVERKFVQICSPGMDEGLARRIAVEFRAAGQEICEKIRHLEGSIATSRRNYLHPELVSTLGSVCG